MVTVCPATVTVPVRGADPVFGSIPIDTNSPPAPVVGDGCSQPTLAVAVQTHELSAVTCTAFDPPELSIEEKVVGATVALVQPPPLPAADWLKLTVRPAMVTDPLRNPPELASTVTVIVPFPVPPDFDTRSHEALLLALQEQVGPLFTETPLEVAVAGRFW